MGGYREGVVHGIMSGTCNTRYFKGRYPQELIKNYDTDTDEIVGLSVVVESPLVSDQGRHLAAKLDEVISFGTTQWNGSSYQSYDFTDNNIWFGFESTFDSFTTNELTTLDVVNYDPSALWAARTALDENPQLVLDNLEEGRRYTTRTYEDDHWEYVIPQMAMSNVIYTTPLVAATYTSVVRPAQREALQARIDKALAANAAIDSNELNNHKHDDDQDENEDLLIACIIGSIALIMMILCCSYKYITRSRMGEMASVAVGHQGNDSVRSNSGLTPGIRNGDDL